MNNGKSQRISLLAPNINCFWMINAHKVSVDSQIIGVVTNFQEEMR